MDLNGRWVQHGPQVTEGSQNPMHLSRLGCRYTHGLGVLEFAAGFEMAREVFEWLMAERLEFPIPQ